MTRTIVTAALALTLLASCAHRVPAATAEPGPGTVGGMMARCPMGVPGTRVAGFDAMDGGSVTFTAPAQVAELRRRVHVMARTHNQHHAAGAPHPEGMMGDATMPASRARVVELSNGASIMLRPTRAADLAQLQVAVRAHVERMQRDGCGTMGMAPPGPHPE